MIVSVNYTHLCSSIIVFRRLPINFGHYLGIIVKSLTFIIIIIIIIIIVIIIIITATAAAAFVEHCYCCCRCKFIACFRPIH